MRKILALTSIRSEYDLMSRLYQLLDADSEIDLQLLVSGAHLSPAHGFTVENIRSDGFNVLAEIETLISADSTSSRLKTASGLLSGSIDIVKRYAPDIILYAGDREDVLVGGMLGGFLGIPTAHFFGGDHAADGHIDNPVRHATSKLSSVHFVSVPEHRNRLLKLGEEDKRIYVIGSVALDKFLLEPVIPRASVLDGIGAKSHAYNAPIAILIFHPISEEIEIAGEYVRNAVSSLVGRGFHVCVGAPNTDPGNFKLVQALEEVSELPQVSFYRNLSRGNFINLFRNSEIIVGNSSAGLLEAASLRVPAINIGARQRGRLCAENVVFTGGSEEDILKAIDQVLSIEFQSMLQSLKNPYGDGNSADIAAGLLKSVDFKALLRKPEDPLYANS